MIGVIFGVLRGVLIVTVLVFLAGFTAMPQDSWWRESIFMDTFHELALWLRQFDVPEITGKSFIQ